MQARHADQLAQVAWQVGDVRDMSSIESATVDVAFDKGTLDAMIYGSPWSPPDEVMENSGRYLDEVSSLFFFSLLFLSLCPYPYP